MTVRVIALAAVPFLVEGSKGRGSTFGDVRHGTCVSHRTSASRWRSDELRERLNGGSYGLNLKQFRP